MEVIEFRPERDQYAFTFGGVAPVRKIHPGTVLRLGMEDAFCGNIRQMTDLPNMDTPEMRADTTCYLAVNVDGGLFSVGDGHYRQGEGEARGRAETVPAE